MEETYAEITEQLDSARSTLDRVVFEVDVLRRLCAALDTARKAARDAYFEPVARQLWPLLASLWDEADLTWSDNAASRRADPQGR